MRSARRKCYSTVQKAALQVPGHITDDLPHRGRGKRMGCSQKVVLQFPGQRPDCTSLNHAAHCGASTGCANKPCKCAQCSRQTVSLKLCQHPKRSVSLPYLLRLHARCNAVAARAVPAGNGRGVAVGHRHVRRQAPSGLQPQGTRTGRIGCGRVGNHAKTAVHEALRCFLATHCARRSASETLNSRAHLKVQAMGPVGHTGDIRHPRQPQRHQRRHRTGVVSEEGVIYRVGRVGGGQQATRHL